MNYQAKINQNRDNKLKDYQENNLLTDEILKQISEEHCVEIKKVYKNIYLSFNGKTIEFDVLIQAETPSGRMRWISIELKESDTSKVISQAIVRRDFVDYSYIILNNSVKWTVQYLFYVYPDCIRENKIGFFCKDTFVLQSKYISPRIECVLDEVSEHG